MKFVFHKIASFNVALCLQSRGP